MPVLYIRDDNGNFVPIKALQGEPGKTPVRGEDYWTEEDQQQIIEDVLSQVGTGGGGDGGGYVIDTLMDVTVEDEVQYIYQAVEGGHKYQQIRAWIEAIGSSQNSSKYMAQIILNAEEGKLWSGTIVASLHDVFESANQWGDAIFFLGPRSECIYGRYNNQQGNPSNMQSHMMRRQDAWDVNTSVTSIRVQAGNWQGWIGTGTHILIQGVRA